MFKSNTANCGMLLTRSLRFATYHCTAFSKIYLEGQDMYLFGPARFMNARLSAGNAFRVLRTGLRDIAAVRFVLSRDHWSNGQQLMWDYGKKTEEELDVLLKSLTLRRCCTGVAASPRAD